MSEKILIASHKGTYTVNFGKEISKGFNQVLESNSHFLIDNKVAEIYKNELNSVLNHQNTILIQATEENKSLELIIPIIKKLIKNKIRRDHHLIAIGGGIIQDITCFISSTLMRGIIWKFFPTTLLAQSDSCIGSKSSINLSNTKNILGTFNPPNEIFIYNNFLKTLDPHDILSGIGEIIKVHAIKDRASFDQLSLDYEKLICDHSILQKYIRKALAIKKKFIEIDEFDLDIRNIFNYGHSFGHAIESVTNFVVPHGIAVTMGMDIANRIASLRGLLPESHFYRMHKILAMNYSDFSRINFSVDDLFSALSKDKKNTTKNLVLILPIGKKAKIEKVKIPPDDLFLEQLKETISKLFV